MSCCERFRNFVTKKQKWPHGWESILPSAIISPLLIYARNLILFINQNYSRDQKFATSFRNDSHISSRNEYRTPPPSFQNDSHIWFRNEIGTFTHFEETVICYFEGIVIFYRKDRPLSSQKEKWAQSYQSVTHSSFQRDCLLSIFMGLYFQPTVLCVIRLVSLPLVRITHKTAGTPEAKNASLWLTYGLHFEVTVILYHFEIIGCHL